MYNTPFDQIFTRQFSWQKFIKAIKYSQSYDVVCQLALLGGKGLNNELKQTSKTEARTKGLMSTIAVIVHYKSLYIC